MKTITFEIVTGFLQCTRKGFLLLSSSLASGRPALDESLFYISVPRWIF
jgi:hypothetical protein